MKILRYLALDVLVHMVAVSFVLLVIIISGRFVKYLAEAAVGDLAAGILVPVLLYRLPGFMELIIPLGDFHRHRYQFPALGWLHPGARPAGHGDCRWPQLVHLSAGCRAL